MRDYPCTDCYRRDRCGSQKCDRWEDWFRQKWRNIQMAAVKKYGPIKGIEIKEEMMEAERPGQGDVDNS